MSLRLIFASLVYVLFGELANADCINLSGKFAAEGQRIPIPHENAYYQFNWMDRMFGKELVKGKRGTTATIRSPSTSALNIEFQSAEGDSMGQIDFTASNARLTCSGNEYLVHTYNVGMGDGFEGTENRYVTAALDLNRDLVLDVRVETTSRFLFIPVRNAPQYYRARFTRLY